MTKWSKIATVTFFYNFFIIFYAPISQLKTLQHTPQYPTRKTNLEGKDGLITPHYLKRNCIFKIKTQQEYNKLTLHDFKHFIKYILPNIRFKLIYSYNFPSQVPYSSLGGINVIPRPSHSLTTLTPSPAQKHLPFALLNLLHSTPCSPQNPLPSCSQTYQTSVARPRSPR